MRHLAIRLGLAAGAALLAVGCGDRDPAENEMQADAVYNGLDFEDQGNDLSAMEMAGNEMAEPVEPANGTGPVVDGDTDAVESTEIGSANAGAPGGDTGGNTMDGNISGM